MHRPRYLWCLLLTPILFVLVVTAIGCGGAAEEPLVRKFFQASRLGDNMTLANIATVSFDPTKDGRAENVKVLEVGTEQSRPLAFKELEKAIVKRSRLRKPSPSRRRNTRTRTSRRSTAC
jgi:hypothetical protein